MDVNRSFTHLEKIDHLKLKEVLKTYSIVNPSLDYCQGMNFIVGFLQLVFEKESLSYAVLKQIIDKFQMSDALNL